MHQLERILASCRGILAAKERGVLVTVVATRGAIYRRSGARAVIAERGEAYGTLGGGSLERDLIERSRLWLADFKPRLLTYDAAPDNDVVFGLGARRQGELELLVEPFDAANPPSLLRDFALLNYTGRDPVLLTTTFEGRELLREVLRPPRSLLLFGSGHEVEPLVRVAQSIGWRVHVVSPKDIHPERVKEMVDVRAHDAAVLMSHDYMHDLALLDTLLPSSIPYVGLVGPRCRADELLAELGNLGDDDRRRLHNPIGLPLGGESPEEQALSIVAEIQSVLSSGSEPRASASSHRDSDRSRSPQPPADSPSR